MCFIEISGTFLYLQTSQMTNPLQPAQLENTLQYKIITSSSIELSLSSLFKVKKRKESQLGYELLEFIVVVSFIEKEGC